jgi:hypothetical protein
MPIIYSPQAGALDWSLVDCVTAADTGRLFETSIGHEAKSEFSEKH